MNFERLDWDSEFFHLNIGRVCIRDQEELYQLVSKSAIKKQYDLIYIFCPIIINEFPRSIALVDQKVIYEKIISNSSQYKSEIYRFIEQQPSAELYNLAIQSGIYSRFKLDGNFPQGSYERLYRKWIEESVRGNLATDVLCHYSNDVVDGMITYKIDGDKSTIGLVAVNNGSRGNGIGSELIRVTEYESFIHGAKQLEVATQKDNSIACNWYEKNSFKIKSITNIYHWWIK